MTVKDIREGRGLTQDQVAAALGVRQAYVSRIERGMANVTIKKLRQLAKIYEVELPELVGSIPEPPTATLPDGSPNPGYLNARAIVCRLARFVPSPILSPAAA